MKIALPGRRSGNLQDRRGAGMRYGGGGMPLPIGMGMGAGAGGIGLIITLVLLLFAGGNPLGGSGGTGVDSPLNKLPGGAPAAEQPLPGAPDPDAALVDFVSFVLDDVQAFWQETFARAGERYTPADLVLFTEATQTGCGVGQAGMGPFYCGADQTAYMDLSFFQELQSRFGAPGDFAQAYVIAHELAHHVQNLTGISEQVARESRGGDANELSVRQELQADCLAGVWGYSTYQRGILESGDLEEGLTAAAAIGDDRLQRQAGGRVNPETWTHGSSEQRVSWFRRGFDSGDPEQCDTFGGDI